jgi:hypothetical protein
MASEWIATQWTRSSDLANFIGGAVQITQQVSPFYDGIRFAVRRGNSCLTMGGEWEYEPLPSDRDDEFYRRCRFASFEAAANALDDYERKAVRRGMSPAANS